MSQTIELKGKKRELKAQTNDSLRKEGLAPAILYGVGIDPLPITLDIKEFEKVFKEAGTNSLVNLKLDDDSQHPVLIHEVSRHPVTENAQHADLYQVNLKETVTTNVPLVFIGESFAVKDSGGVLVKNIHEIEIEALPTDLPHQLEVDLSKLKTFEDRILVSDILVPLGVKVLTSPDEIVALASEPMSQEEIEAAEKPAEEALGEIKTEKEIKKAEGEAKQAQEDEIEK
ncbi:MAG: 50S ribosomal protein L25 [Patescibacteria group bacterium]